MTFGRNHSVGRFMTAAVQSRFYWYQLIVCRIPSPKGTFGSQPNSVRALVAGMIQEASQILLMPGGGESVEVRNLGIWFVLEEPADKVAADKAGAACD